jgi:hypothetical protein
MAENERYFVNVTNVGKPVPAEYTFNADSHVIQIWEDQFKEEFRIRFDILMHFSFPFLIDDADVHFSSVKIDTAIVLVLLIVEFHNLASFGWGL